MRRPARRSAPPRAASASAWISADGDRLAAATDSSSNASSSSRATPAARGRSGSRDSPGRPRRGGAALELPRPPRQRLVEPAGLGQRGHERGPRRTAELRTQPRRASSSICVLERGERLGGASAREADPSRKASKPQIVNPLGSRSPTSSCSAASTSPASKARRPEPDRTTGSTAVRRERGLHLERGLGCVARGVEVAELVLPVRPRKCDASGGDQRADPAGHRRPRARAPRAPRRRPRPPSAPRPRTVRGTFRRRDQRPVGQRAAGELEDLVGGCAARRRGRTRGRRARRAGSSASASRRGARRPARVVDQGVEQVVLELGGEPRIGVADAIDAASQRGGGSSARPDTISTRARACAARAAIAGSSRPPRREVLVGRGIPSRASASRARAAARAAPDASASARRSRSTATSVSPRPARAARPRSRTDARPGSCPARRPAAGRRPRPRPRRRRRAARPRGDAAPSARRDEPGSVASRIIGCVKRSADGAPAGPRRRAPRGRAGGGASIPAARPRRRARCVARARPARGRAQRVRRAGQPPLDHPRDRAGHGPADGVGLGGGTREAAGRERAAQLADQQRIAAGGLGRGGHELGLAPAARRSDARRRRC